MVVSTIAITLTGLTLMPFSQILQAFLCSQNSRCHTAAPLFLLRREQAEARPVERACLRCKQTVLKRISLHCEEQAIRCINILQNQQKSLSRYGQKYLFRRLYLVHATQGCDEGHASLL